MLNKRLMLIPMLLLMAGCSDGQGSDCLAFSPIYVDKADNMTIATKRQIVAQNELGEELCNWKPTLAQMQPEPTTEYDVNMSPELHARNY